MNDEVMRRLRRALGAVLPAALLLVSAAQATPRLATLGSDALGLGRVLTHIDASGNPKVVSVLADAPGAAPTQYSSLSLRPADGRYYALGNDAEGRSSLVSFDGSDSASLTLVAALGSGFAGLAYRPGEDVFYAASTNAGGESTLMRIGAGGGVDVVGPLGLGFVGGLAFGATPAWLFGISADALGVPRTLQQIDPGTGAATPLFELGDGSLAFHGGLAWNFGAARFELIGSDAFGQSSLFSLDLDGPASLALIGVIGTGYVHTGLTSAVPEPGRAALLLAGLIGLWAGLFVRTFGDRS